MRQRICTLDVTVRRALHVAAPLDTAVAALRFQVHHQLLVAIVPPPLPASTWCNGGWGGEVSEPARADASCSVVGGSPPRAASLGHDRCAQRPSGGLRRAATALPAANPQNYGPRALGASVGRFWRRIGPRRWLAAPGQAIEAGYRGADSRVQASQRFPDAVASDTRPCRGGSRSALALVVFRDREMSREAMVAWMRANSLDRADTASSSRIQQRAGRLRPCVASTLPTSLRWAVQPVVAGGRRVGWRHGGCCADGDAALEP